MFLNDVICCEAPPPNLNFANIFYARFGAKPSDLMTANISGYMVPIIPLSCITAKKNCLFGWLVTTTTDTGVTGNPIQAYTDPGVFFFWTHFRLSLRTAIHMRMRSATLSVYLDL